MNEAKYQFVVAVDIGTAYTKLSWTSKQSSGIVASKDVFLYDQWPGVKDKLQVPTAVLYRPVITGWKTKWEMYAFGQQAIDLHLQDEEAASFPLFRNFKMALHAQKTFSTKVEVSGDYQKNGKTWTLTLPALDIFADILKHLETVIEQRLSYAHGELFTKSTIQWVLTVPAMWRASARDFMRQAAIKAQIYEFFKPRQVAIALEPESAALHVRSVRHELKLATTIQNAKLYIVIDIGGGTIDIAVHKVHCQGNTGGEEIHEIKGCMGSDRGATCIDRAFETFLCGLDISGYPNFFQDMKQNPKSWHELMMNFEVSKGSFDGSSEVMRIGLPRHMFDSYQEKTGDRLVNVLTKAANPKVYIPRNSDFLHVSKDICIGWYRPTIDSVVEQVESLHKEFKADALFLVGGFANCDILRREMKKIFSNMPLVIPPVPGLAVIKGAVQYGTEPKAIASRISYATYGVACSTAFIEGTHDPEKKFWSKRSARYNCNDIFSVFVRKGEEVNPSKSYTKVFNTTSPDELSAPIDVYATDEKEPMYVKGCQPIGNFTIPLESLPAGVKAEDDYRNIKVTMDFSGTEIFVSFEDNSGKHYQEKTLDFLPVDDY